MCIQKKQLAEEMKQKKKRTWPEQIGCQPLMCARKFKELPLWADT